MKQSSLNTRLNDPNIKILFTDYFDTLVHRIVHPNYTLRIWAKILIREFGLRGSVDSLYFVRRESGLYLKEQLNCSEVEIPYEVLKDEVFKRLLNNLVLQEDQYEIFIEYFELADLKAELSVQYLNQEVVDSLKEFKNHGKEIYLISDFYGSIPLFERMLEAHGIGGLFNGVFSSAALQKSKENASIYPEVLKITKADTAKVLMIGDNKLSDYENAMISGIDAYLLPHKHIHLRNKLRGLGSDKSSLKRAVNNSLRQCQISTSPALSEYVIMLYFFVERLYATAKRFNLNDLVFLSREGLILKELFDSYQERHNLTKEHWVRTHYLKISRQAALQITLKPLEEESFEYLRKHFGDLSLNEFFNFLNFSKEIKQQLNHIYKTGGADVIPGFFDSETFKNLTKTGPFPEIYETHRKQQKEGFRNYFDSLGVKAERDGLHLVDVGWGGTMQEAIHTYFEGNVQVSGYYLGLKKTYNITSDTKRFGLLFSIQPYEVYSDHILMANTQFYEQLLTAHHGGISGYDHLTSEAIANTQTKQEIEFFENQIKPWQDGIRLLFQNMLEDYAPLCYDYDMVQRQLTKVALQTGLRLNRKKLRFIHELNSHFKQNIGVEQTGIVYRSSDAGNTWDLIKRAIIQPEAIFRYLVKIKPLIYSKNKLLGVLLPISPTYYYYLFNRFVREKLLKRQFFLQFNYFK